MGRRVGRPVLCFDGRVHGEETSQNADAERASSGGDTCLGKALATEIDRMSLART